MGQCLMGRAANVDAATRFGQPELNTVPLQQDRDLRELITGRECPLILANHHRVEPSPYAR